MKLTAYKILSRPIKPSIKSIKKDGDDGLPTEDTDGIGSIDPLSLRYLFVAPPGFGKSEFFMCFPDSLLLACEEGHKMIRGKKIIIDCFDFKGHVREPWIDPAGNSHMSFIQAVELIEESNRFKFVIVDTVDALIKMIVDFSGEKFKVDHIDEIGEWGKGFDLGQNTPFRRAMSRLLKTGRGIGYVTHQQVNQAKFKSGTQAKKETTLPSGISKLIIPQVDIAFHGEFGRKMKGSKGGRFRERIMVTEGSEEALAKNRGGILPCKFILPLNGRWETFNKFFTDPTSVKKAEAEYEKHYPNSNG